jgi:ribosome-associated translation inhibitor RaiA
MTQSPSVVIHFREIEPDEELKRSIEKQGLHLAEEFHEIARIEISLEANGAGFTAHGHVTGKGTDVATHAEASKLGPAADLVFHKLEPQLRKLHDKRIFAQRRKAQRDPPKRHR